MKKPVGRFRSCAGLTSGAHRRALAGVVLLVSLAACGGTSSTASEATLGEGSTSAPVVAQITEPPSNASETTVVAGTPAESPKVPELLQFTAPLVGGGEFNGADRAGQATAFWFWAPT